LFIYYCNFCKMSGKNRKRTASSSSSAEEPDSEEESRLKDLQERDAFANRLKQRDDDRTRKVVESTGGRKAIDEATKRLKLEHEDRDKIVPHLRVQSRRQYLEKRKDDKVAELEADILDDEYLFDESV